MKLFDVVEVDTDTMKITLMAENKTKKNAEAIESFAIMRRGNDSNFFTSVPAGKYSNGDKYLTGDDDTPTLRFSRPTGLESDPFTAPLPELRLVPEYLQTNPPKLHGFIVYDDFDIVGVIGLEAMKAALNDS